MWQSQPLLPYQGEYKKITSKNTSDKEVDEFEVYSLAKRLGITKEEMENMSFVSLMNILISSVESDEQEATEADVRRMFG